MIEWKQMTMQEAENKMEVLREIFDVVRLLKGSDLQAAGMESKLAGRENLCQCYAFWNKDKRCENCISVKALNEKKQTSKIEFLDSDMYQVFARYLEIDSEPYVMEMLKKLDESTLTGLLIAVVYTAVIWMAWGSMNAIVCILHLIVFWMVSEAIFALITKIRKKTFAKYYAGIVAIVFTVCYLAAG